MEAPDKIYVMPSTFMEFGYIDVVCKNKKGIEYIRKDALLEWAKEQATITEKLNGKGAMLKAWDSLIDKIESL